MSEALAAYRALLRAVNRNITFATGNRSWLEHTREEFRRHRGAADPAEAAQLVQLAKDYAFMIHGVREHTVGGTPQLEAPQFSLPPRRSLFPPPLRSCCGRTTWVFRWRTGSG
jgi:hypothetical protein